MSPSVCLELLGHPPRVGPPATFAHGFAYPATMRRMHARSRGRTRKRNCSRTRGTSRRRRRRRGVSSAYSRVPAASHRTIGASLEASESDGSTGVPLYEIVDDEGIADGPMTLEQLMAVEDLDLGSADIQVLGRMPQVRRWPLAIVSRANSQSGGLHKEFSHRRSDRRLGLSRHDGVRLSRTRHRTLGRASRS